MFDRPVLAVLALLGWLPGAVACLPASATADWPLTFKRHLFGAFCYNTVRCEVRYDGRDHGTAAKTSNRPAQHNRILIASYGDLPNFPPPAQLRWRSKDGSEHNAIVDFSAIFPDNLVRHEVPRPEMAVGVSIGFTHVLLEIDDRTVNVYTRTMIPTKDPQSPGNPHSYFRDELIKVYSRSY